MQASQRSFRFGCETLVVASLVHPYGAPDTLPLEQQVKSFVDVLEADFMGYELVKLQLLDRGKSKKIIAATKCQEKCIQYKAKTGVNGDTMLGMSEASCTLFRYLSARMGMSCLGFTPPYMDPMTDFPWRIS